LALLLADLHALRDAGFEGAYLHVDAETPTGAPALYRSVGFVERKRQITYQRVIREETHGS
jgi:hypothetical protein